jgi:crotonobetainyl-CoA:carnitine CoA-transferase CaiB-like acyl-CoA transferase
LSEIFRQKTQEELLQLFEGANCCVSPVNTLTEALDSVPACERQVLSHLEHPKLGAIPQIASPMLNKQQRRAFRTQVHDNNGEVIKLLKTLGFKENYIKDLCRDGIVRLNEETQ